MNALGHLLELSKDEKLERGLLYTPAEIAQQPATWESTFSLFQDCRAELAEFLAKAGFGDRSQAETNGFSHWGGNLRLHWQKSGACSPAALAV